MKRINTSIIYFLLLFLIIITACSKKPDNDPIDSVDSSSREDRPPCSALTEAAAIAPESYCPSDAVITPLISTNPVPHMESVNLNKKDIHRSKKMVAIDAGHQRKGNYKEEPIGPGADKLKPKVSSGTIGRSTGVPEYKLNLVIALKVKKELINRGYQVYMVREKNNINLSNRERAELANKSGADIFIRIHADSSVNTGVNGTSTLYPSKDNPYVPKLSNDSYSLSKAIVNAICNSTGSKNRGSIARDDMSGINWCKIPVSIIEMGFMSNKKEDRLMQTRKYQRKIVKGICDGIDKYFDIKK